MNMNNTVPFVIDPSQRVEPKAYEMRVLDPAALHLSYAPEGNVRLEIEGELCYLSVDVGRSFPVHDQEHYLSLRNALDEELVEIGMVLDVAGLDAESRLIVERELYRRYFVPQIQKVTYLKEEFGVLNFEAETDRGPREFSVRNPQENVREVEEDRLMIIDIDGCRYEVPDLNKLDKKSINILRDYIDS